jgi:hypothetical protein
MGIATTSNWIFPLNILLTLPFESCHRHKVRRTLAAVSFWLGSPQTALTAAVWNFRQTRRAYRRAREANSDRSDWMDALFIITVFNQFDLKLGKNDQRRRELLEALMYGLFQPLSNDRDGDGDGVHLATICQHHPTEIQMTRELLATLAFSLRMLRRRGVIPTLASLATFLLAFIFSVVLAFGDISGDSIAVFSLNLGLLVSWLPVLVIFSVVDRNPVSSERVA